MKILFVNEKGSNTFITMEHVPAIGEKIIGFPFNDTLTMVTVISVAWVINPKALPKDLAELDIDVIVTVSN